MRRFAWGLIAFLAAAIAGYSVWVYFNPGVGAPFVRERFGSVPLAMGAHLLGGAAALVIGALQVNARLRNAALPVHRFLGRLYLLAVAAGGLGSLVLATRSQFGFVTHLGFGLLGVLWLGTTGRAFAHIRRGEWRDHRRWMIRSYALTLAAVMLRIYLPVFASAGIPFPTSYQLISWLAWVPNLLVAEWWLRGPGLEPVPADARRQIDPRYSYPTKNPEIS